MAKTEKPKSFLLPSNVPEGQTVSLLSDYRDNVLEEVARDTGVSIQYLRALRSRHHITKEALRIISLDDALVVWAALKSTSFWLDVAKILSSFALVSDDPLVVKRVLSALAEKTDGAEALKVVYSQIVDHSLAILVSLKDSMVSGDMWATKKILELALPGWELHDEALKTIIETRMLRANIF